MSTHTDKITDKTTPDNKQESQTSGNGVSQKQSVDKSTFQFIDKRPETVAQTKLQEMANNSPRAIQLKSLQETANNSTPSEQQPIQKKGNNTGLPDNLKTGMENLSGMSLDDVKVHRNSNKPAQLQAHAYAQGADIHLGAGQEKHLPHEAWHVVQQKQGRVKPTKQMKGKVNINDDAGLEKEADVMGAKALVQSKANNQTNKKDSTSSSSNEANKMVQRVSINLQPADNVITALVKYAREQLGVSDVMFNSIGAAHGRVLGPAENIYLFGHGGYSAAEVEEHDRFGSISMPDLATGLNSNFTFPENYTGTIYLVGCKTDSLLGTLKPNLDHLTGQNISIKGTTETVQTGEDEAMRLRDQPTTESEVKRRETADIQRFFYQHLIRLRNLRTTALGEIRAANDFEAKKVAIFGAYQQKGAVDGLLNGVREGLQRLRGTTSIRLKGKISGLKGMEEIFAKSKIAQNKITGCLVEFVALYEQKPIPPNALTLEAQIIQKLTQIVREDRGSLRDDVQITAMMVQINDEPDMLHTSAFSLDQMVDVNGANVVKNLKNGRIHFNSVTEQIQGWTNMALKRTPLWKEINAEFTDPQQDWSDDRIADRMNAKIKNLRTYLAALHRIQVSRSWPEELYRSANSSARRKLDIDRDFNRKKHTFTRLLERDKPGAFNSKAVDLCDQMKDVANRLMVDAASETSSDIGHGSPFGMF